MAADFTNTDTGSSTALDNIIALSLSPASTLIRHFLFCLCLAWIFLFFLGHNSLVLSLSFYLSLFVTCSYSVFFRLFLVSSLPLCLIFSLSLPHPFSLTFTYSITLLFISSFSTPLSSHISFSIPPYPSIPLSLFF